MQNEKKFRKKTGTTDQGKDYEDCLIAFVTLKLITNSEVENFELSSNNDDFGCFDDVVLEISLKRNCNKNIALQLKHFQRDNKISTNSLAAKDGAFSLQKYQKSFEKLGDDFEVILYTNKTMEINGELTFSLDGKDVQIQAIQQLCSEANLLNTCENKGSIVTFKVVENDVKDRERYEILNYRKFFEKFSIYVNQKNVEKITEASSNMFEQAFGLDQAPAFINFIKKWSQRDGFKEKLDKETVKLKICEILLTPYIKLPTETRYEENCRNFGKIVKQFDVTVCEGLENFPNLWFVEESIDDDMKKKIQQIATRFGIAFGHVYIESMKEIEKVLIFWHLNVVPLNIGVNNANKNVVQKVLNLCKKDRKFIFVDDAVVDLQDLEVTAFQNLSDLNINGEYYEHILEFTCSLQGRKPTPLKNILEIDPSMYKAITPTQLVKMLDNNFCIGKSTEKLPDYYVSRYFSKILIHNDFISKSSSDLSVISCRGKLDKIEKLCVNINLLELDKYLSTDDSAANNNNFQNNFICYHKKLCSDEDFQKFCEKNTDKVCHHLQTTKSGKLQWLTSSGDLTTLRRYLIYDEHVQESEIFNSVHNKFNIICGEAGMGKSVMISYLKNHYPFGYWVISLNVREHYLSFREKCDDEEILNFICNLESTICDKFEAEMKRIFQDRRKIVILWDGFDELPNEFLADALSVLKKLTKTDIVQWVTVRPHFKNLLEDTFEVFALTINEFKEDQQRNYIKQRFVEQTDVEMKEVTTKIFTNIATMGGNEFLGVPLQIYMLTDLFFENWKKYLSLLDNIFSISDLYHKFFEKKIDFIFTKTTFDTSNSITRSVYEDYKLHRLQMYEILALKIYLNEEVSQLMYHHTVTQEFLQKIKSEGDYLDIVRVNDNGLPIFVHNTFGEYFAARWLSKNWKYVPLQAFLFEEKHSTIRLIFDMMLAENCPAHLAVLHKNIDSLKNNKNTISLKDKSGRNPLQLICSWGERHNFLDAEQTGGKYLINLKKCSSVQMTDTQYDNIVMLLLEENCDPFEKDNLLSWNSIEYCKYNLALRPLNSIISKIPNFSLKKLWKSLEDITSVLYYSTWLGYEHLFSCIDSVPIFEDKASSTNILHLCAQYGRFKFLPKVLANVKYKNYINKRRRCLMEYTMVAPRINTSTGCFKIEMKFITAASQSALEIAIDCGHIDVATSLLSKKPSLNGTDNYTVTALHLASGRGHVDILEMLIKAGADINKPCIEGFTALHFAVSDQKLQCIQLLLDKGSDVFEDNHGMTPLDLAASMGYQDAFKMILPKCDILDINRSLLPAASNGQIEIMQYLLNEKKVNVNFDHKGVTALHCASENGFFDAVKFLIGRNAAVNSQDECGRTALHCSATRGFLKIIKYLIKHQANANLTDRDGQTPFHYAVLFGDVQVLSFLLKSGADRAIADSKGNTPMSLAQQSQNKDVCQFFTSCPS